MDLEDKFLSKGIQSLSSSVQSTPDKNGHSDDVSRSPELPQEFLKPGPKKELFRTCFDKEKKYTASSKCKMTDQPQKTSKKILKNQEPKKASISPKGQTSSGRKSQRKGENPVRIPPSSEESPDFGNSNSWLCKNAACRAILSIEDTFCKRCSCCICHLFDDNKDPSLWLVCSSDSGTIDSCGLSCHIECALQREKVGVVDLGQLMQLDGSYCCASCGKVSGILGCWKKQLNIAKDARRVDVLCYRIFLSYRLLDGSSRFKELHEIVRDAKAKLETEVGPVNGVSAKMARGIVSRLPVAGEVLKLCSLAIDKADEWLAAVSNKNSTCREGSLPAACRFHFEEVTSSSVVIVLIELPASSGNDIEGYKLWYCKSRDETHPKEPISVFPKAQRRILISNLQPCTEYSFRIISYVDSGDFGHSEAKCFTKSVEIIHKNAGSASMNHTNGNPHFEESKTPTAIGSSPGFKVRDLGKLLQLVWAKEQGCFDGFSGMEIENIIKPVETPKEPLPSVSRGLDLNVASVPDLNEELTPPFEFSRDEEDNGCTLGPVDDAASHDIAKNCLAGSHGSGDSQNWAHGANGEVAAVDSRTESRKRAATVIEETHDCNSTLISGSPFRMANGLGCLDENFEYCVKIIRWLECEGHIQQEFRLKLLTWFSLRSTEQERRVVNTFIHTLIDDPSSLAAQLVDSFSDIVSSKRPRNGFCSKLWH
ncbi:VIN3-like protein 1 isoform X2 [Rhododendron vialii]|uniref:VIN3-like protein 1 isoform X2 n=1 Tax=Rhododendron vialii TaxID=182163 RepID=UPI00265DBCD1|nr:VIN3-like protein 1 isoform X2 [Rhododendron vialii]XP_058184328.1 VIN3-like protein 1 isoform X2 [Rhododendron vialii]